MAETQPSHHLLASDFDQTLSHNDSGQILSEMIGVGDFQQKVDGLAHSNLVHQGGELAYLIRHDPAFRGVRREHLEEVGRRVRLKRDIPRLLRLLGSGLEGSCFSFFVISAAPREVIQSALAGVLAAENIFGTEFDYDPHSGEVRSIVRVPAGYGKVTVIEELENRLGTASSRTIYVGDGSSDVHVMLHVNNRDGFTISVSENLQLARIARSTVLSDTAFGVLAPILHHVVGHSWDQIRDLFAAHDLTVTREADADPERIHVREK